MDHESSNLCDRYSHQRIGTKTGELERAETIQITVLLRSA